MKKLLIILAAVLMVVSCKPKQLKPWDKGGLDTGKYRNVFAEMGYPKKEIDAKLESIFQEVFYGPNKVYFEVGDDMAYISDIKNYDARTEGMSYGLMICVQLDKKQEFDRLWRWAKKYMQYQEGPMKGYFAWSLSVPDGQIRGAGPASDGELYFITALVFASNRWGNDGEINYLAEAQNILNSSWEKDGSWDGIMPFINKEHHLITFTPDGGGVNYTDPSYHLPAFYEVWARWAYDGRADFYRECAKASREYLHKSIDPVTGLNPDYNNYDGTFFARGFGGRNQKPTFRFDSWRVPMNIALDYSWACADKEWQTNYANTIQSFFYSKGIDDFVDQYNVDGTEPETVMRAGMREYAGQKLRHSVGLVATTAAVTLAADNDISREFVQRLWDSKNEPYDDGYFDAYYDGILRLFAFMHLSGHYQAIPPQK